VTPRARRGTAIALALGCTWTGGVACTAEQDAEADAGTPWQEWISPDAACPVTLPMSPDRYPKALRDQEGKTTWYGDGALWVDLGGLYDAPRVGDSVRAEHAWWTVDPSGEATVEETPPTVRATRLDGPGHEVAAVSGRSDGTYSWWPTRLTLPAGSCWLVAGELGDTVVRVVVKAG
jgi:hypothetical protein